MVKSVEHQPLDHFASDSKPQCCPLFQANHLHSITCDDIKTKVNLFESQIEKIAYVMLKVVLGKVAQLFHLQTQSNEKVPCSMMRITLTFKTFCSNSFIKVILKIISWLGISLQTAFSEVVNACTHTEAGEQL